MSKEDADIRKSIEKLEKDEEERIKRMRELISQLDIKLLEGQSLMEIKKLKCPKCEHLYFPKLDDRSCPKCSK